MHPVIQEENTGCAIASCAAIAHLSYQQMKDIANSIGIYADDPSLWSDTRAIKNLLAQLGIPIVEEKKIFSRWDKLPDCALLAIKWHSIAELSFWHWVVFTRQAGQPYILDSNAGLKHNLRTDFGRIKPKWFIEIVR